MLRSPLREAATYALSLFSDGVRSLCYVELACATLKTQTMHGELGTNLSVRCLYLRAGLPGNLGDGLTRHFRFVVGC